MQKSLCFGAAVVLAFIVLVSGTTIAAVPGQITVQGKLTDPGGVPAAPGVKTFTFRIFDSSIGGVQVWPAIGGEVQSVSTDIDGLWTAQVGLLNPLSDNFFTGIERWLEITVDDGINPPETLTRLKINASAYSYRIGSVDGAKGGRLTSKLSVGTTHTNTGTDAFVAGNANIVAGEYSTAPGGTLNWAFADYSAVGGGEQNRALGSHSFIGAGLANVAEGGFGATIAGGFENRTGSADISFIGGGRRNRAIGEGTVVSGGGYNVARASYAVIGGGGSASDADSNVAAGNYSVIGGGTRNQTHADWAVISGGHSNVNSRVGATIAGGYFDTANGDFSAIGGGVYNSTGEYAATVSGGQGNRASAQWATVVGGKGNHAHGRYSLAAGHRAQADVGSFVWADDFDADFPAAGDPILTGPFDRQLLARASGGVTIVTAVSPAGFALNGVTVPAGSGSWSSLSDRESKSDIREVKPDEILAKVAALPVSEWSYRSQSESIRHIGPMAQDFHSAFGVGEDPRRIASIDADGVALAAIKALHEITERQSAEIEYLKRQLEELLHSGSSPR